MSADTIDVIANGSASAPAAPVRMSAGVAVVLLVAGFLGGAVVAREQVSAVPVAAHLAASPVLLFPPDWLVYRAGERSDRPYQPHTAARRSYRAGAD